MYKKYLLSQFEETSKFLKARGVDFLELYYRTVLNVLRRKNYKGEEVPEVFEVWNPTTKSYNSVTRNSTECEFANEYRFPVCAVRTVIKLFNLKD